MRTLFLILLLLSFGLIFMDLSVSTLAQTKPVILDHCANAKNNNDSLVCVKQQHEKSVEELNDVYEGVQALQSSESLDNFRASQRDWIAYRDKECNWTKEKNDNDMIKRIDELSCLTRLTKMRTSVLGKHLQKEELGTVEALASIPLWINILGEKFPEVFWQTAKNIHGDLDCDNSDEQILTGVRIYHSEPQQQEAYVAIIDTPLTGQPKASVLKFPVAKALQDTHVCSANLELTLSPKPELTEDEVKQATVALENPEKKACKATLTLNSKNCEPIHLIWDGKTYVQTSGAL